MMPPEKKRAYECERCDYRCNFRQNLRRHRKTHEAKSVHCEHCPYICRLPQHLRRHLRLVHSFDPDQATGPLFVCASCQFATGSAKAMGSHCARLHNDPKPWRCSRCEYRARSRCIIRYHEEQVHERRRPFRCETCGLAAVSRRVLAIHRVVHSSDPTPYRCDRCAYATRFLSNLTKHMIVHTDAKPFECSVCDMRFARKANLKTHLKKAHQRFETPQVVRVSDNANSLKQRFETVTAVVENSINANCKSGWDSPPKDKQLAFDVTKNVNKTAFQAEAYVYESDVAQIIESSRDCKLVLQKSVANEIALGSFIKVKTSVHILSTEAVTVFFGLPTTRQVPIVIDGNVSRTSQNSIILNSQNKHDRHHSEQEVH